MDIVGPSQPGKRQALLVALPPTTTAKKSKTLNTDKCAVCEKSTSSKSNPLQQSSPEAWNNLAEKAQEW